MRAAPHRLAHIWLVAGLCLTLAGGWHRLGAAPTAARAARVPVSVKHDADAGTWTFGGPVALTVAFARDGTLVLRSLDAADGTGALLPDMPDASIVLDGRQLVLGDRKEDGIRFVADRQEAYGAGTRLSLVFEVADQHARVTRHFVAYPAAPVLETWFEVERLDGDVAVQAEGLMAWRADVASRDVRWLRGLEMDDARDLSFRPEARVLVDGESVEFGAAGRATERNMPWMAARTAGGTFVGGLLWSGAWRIFAQAEPGGTAILAMLDAVSTTVPAGRALEGVHGFVGYVAGDETAVPAAMRAFLVDGLRGGRGFPSLVTYNTWFVHGVNIDADVAAEEIKEAANVGAELFQLDAGWYVGTGRGGPYDFTSGLGSWQPDLERFPEGLRAVGDLARAHGMKFALWVEPERADLATVNVGDGPREAWLATSGGAYRPGIANQDAGYAQVCLAHPDAWQWAFDHLSHLIVDEGVDYLKIDSNDWINCTRDGHGHGPADGHFAHVQALYRLLQALRERFPSLLIENCSGGGNRIDFGLARYTDVGWMDDRTHPAAHVRQNAEGLSSVLPPAYLLSYVMPSEEEPLHDAADFSLLTRSRMPGVLGLSYRANELDESDYVELGGEVDVYKRARGVAGDGYGIRLSAPMSESSRPAWEIEERVRADGQGAVVYAFQNDESVHRVRVVLKGLAPDTTFRLTSMEHGVLGTLPGRVLMDQGVDLPGSPNTLAHVVFVEPAPSGGSAKRP